MICKKCNNQIKTVKVYEHTDGRTMIVCPSCEEPIDTNDMETELKKQYKIAVGFIVIVAILIFLLVFIK